ncbi:MAG TPA: NAD(P)-dependent oxidoreductase [Stellaceae bacterium]|nr:NAD(P)-dependent oxidoreductase [Stellaceae bacterium]
MRVAPLMAFLAAADREAMMLKRVLITGATGFLGLNLIDRAIADGLGVVAVDRSPPPGRTPDRWPASIVFRQADMADPVALGQAFALGADAVIHAAAITNGAAGAMAEVNVGGTVRVIRLAIRHGIRRLVLISSGAVYGGVPIEPPARIPETAEPEPLAPYGTSKLAAEAVARALAEEHGLDLTIIRLPPLFGPWEYATGARVVLSPQWQCLDLARRGLPIRLSRPGSGDWWLAPHAAAAILGLLRATNGRFVDYNIGPGVATTAVDWCRCLTRFYPALDWRIADDPADATITILAARDRAPLDPSRLHAAIGAPPAWDLDAAADAYLAWPGENP